MYILTAIQRPTELPVVNVVALVLILPVIPVYLAQRISDIGRPLAVGRRGARPLRASAVPAPAGLQGIAMTRRHDRARSRDRQGSDACDDLLGRGSDRRSTVDPIEECPVRIPPPTVCPTALSCD